MPKVKHGSTPKKGQDEKTMSEKPNTTKKSNQEEDVSKHPHSYEPYTKPRSQFENMIKNCISKHQDKLKIIEAKRKLLNKTMETLNTAVGQKDEEIWALKQQIEQKQKEIVEVLETHNKLMSENEPLKLELKQYKENYAGLEITYNNECEKLRAEYEQLKEQIEQQKLNNLKITQEFDATRNEWQNKLDAKENELAAQEKKMQELQRSFNQSETALQNERQKLQHFETEIITSFKNELLEKDAIIDKCRKDKDALELEKNKIIKEQSFKISEIERVFHQSTNAVLPQSNRNTSPVFVAPVAPNVEPAQSSNIVTRVSTALISQADPACNTSRSNSTAQQLLPAERRQRARPQRRYQLISTNCSSTEDDDADSTFGGWRVNIPNSAFEEESQETPIGFRRPNSAYAGEPTVYVAGTSGSEITNPRSN